MRLQKLSNQISFSRSLVIVKVSKNQVRLYVNAPQEVFERIIEHIVSLINVNYYQLSQDEISQAVITTVKFMKGNSTTIKKGVSLYDS